MKLDRRSILRLGILLGLLPQQALAIGKRSEISIARLKLGPDALHRPESLRRLLWDARTRTSINVARDAISVGFSDLELFWQPLLVWTGKADPGPLSEEDQAKLRQYLQFGGMLWIDADEPGSPFQVRAKDEVERALGEKFSVLKKEHVLFKSFFLLDKVYGRTMREPRAFGLQVNQRTGVIMTQSDVLGALERDRLGSWRFDCLPDGDRQRERAFRLGINMLMYATCTDYKADQVHIPFIMKKKRR